MISSGIRAFIAILAIAIYIFFGYHISNLAEGKGYSFNVFMVLSLFGFAIPLAIMEHFLPNISELEKE